MQQDETGRGPPLIERVRARQERHRERNRIYRVVFAAVGFVVLAAGVVMLVTPGPGIPVIIIGLGMLALEFAWAERWLERLLDIAEQAVDEVAHGSPLRRALILGAGAVAAAAIVVMVIVWDIPYFPG
ncbi:MAG TPA: PGPGW domain-containing protein [Gaiellaceae bacterium]|nr:PGPGW domain-containing protein [Gaiellaceae bacterium]